ncbi:MAG: hypothetical protein QG637_1078, partial [Chloroflexota bacterium]|nr:hypothetical protein [Chloroflexota bacterium]
MTPAGPAASGVVLLFRSDLVLRATHGGQTRHQRD